MEGGNIFEGPRQHEYPTPPLTPTYTMGFFHKAATQMGYHPFPLPAANLSQAYTNPDNVSRPGCVFCGYCPNYGCMIGAKAQPTNTLMPVLTSRNNFLLRNNCWVRKIVHRKGQAEGVVYMDENGEETMQPAEVVVLSAWTPNSVRLLLLSDIGEKYDPVTAKGTLGKNLTHQVTSGAAGMLVFKERLNLFMGSGAVGYGISDLRWRYQRGGSGKNFAWRNLPARRSDRRRAQPVRSAGFREAKLRATGARRGRRLRLTIGTGSARASR